MQHSDQKIKKEINEVCWATCMWFCLESRGCDVLMNWEIVYSISSWRLLQFFFSLSILLLEELALSIGLSCLLLGIPLTLKLEELYCSYNNCNFVSCAD